MLYGAPALEAQISETNLFNSVNKVIPDGNAAGVHDVRTITSQIAFLTSVRVRLNISGKFNGDLYGYVRHSTGLAILLNRPGRTLSNFAGYEDSGLDVVFSDLANTNDIHNYRLVTTPLSGSPLTGTWQPDARFIDPDLVTDVSPRTAFLSALTNLNANGDWTLFLADMYSGGTNFLNSWGIEIQGGGKLTPQVTWSNPANLGYGTPLGASQLNAGASVAGTFVYNPPAGTILNAGASQPLSVTFTPTDTNTYFSVATNVSVTVTQALTVDAISSSANPALPGQQVTFTATLSTAASGATPGGSVQFRVDGSVFGGPVSLSNGVAHLVTSSLSVGSHDITAEYAGDSNYRGTTNSLTPREVINTPPVANGDSIDRPANQGTKVAISTLLTNDTDADGDALTLTGVNPTSAMGGTVTVSNGWIYYTPPPGFTNTDSFTYSIADGRGGTASATVTVNISVDTGPSGNLTITLQSASSVLLSFSGIPGRTYTIQYSGTVTNTNWQSLTSQTADSMGRFQYIDTPVTNRFYRSVYP
jgi:subtilisin-like proprotein convertase family protein